jgi:uncharacterized protein YlxW (UPF0749 family)
MALLADLTNNTLDAGYRRPAEPPPGAAGIGPRRSIALCAVFVLAGLVLGTSARQTHESAPAARAAQTALSDRVHVRNAQVDALQHSLTSSRVDLEGYRGEDSAANSASSAARSDVDRLSILAGATPVHGPGIKVVVDDAPNAAGAAHGTGRIRDSDLQRLLNGLWAAGAEAISVNGARLTTLTAVRTAGDAILVAYRPLSPPYEVLAIGAPSDLEVDFVDGPGGRWFHTLSDRYGIRFNVTTAADVSLPGAISWTLRVAEEDTRR